MWNFWHVEASFAALYRNTDINCFQIFIQTIKLETNNTHNHVA